MPRPKKNKGGRPTAAETIKKQKEQIALLKAAVETQADPPVGLAEPSDVSPHVEVTDEAEPTRQARYEPANQGITLRACRNSPDRLAHWRSRGYEIAKLEDVKSHNGYEAPDKTIQWRDLILMKCSRERYEARKTRERREQADYDRAMNEALDGSARDGLPGEGIHTYDEHRQQVHTSAGGRRRVYNIPIDLKR